MKVLLIIPAYNEEESILKTVQAVQAYQQTVAYQLDYIVINDGSTDGTQHILDTHHIPSVQLILNLGIGGAVQTGYQYAHTYNYDIAVQFDGDGQHDVTSLDDLIQPIINKQAHLVVGSRFANGGQSEFQTTLMRRIGIKIISTMIKLVTGKRIYDTTSGYRAADKTIIKQFANRYPSKYPEPESIVHMLKRGYTVSEQAVNMFERTGGVSSITPIKSIRYMVEVCTAILVAGLMKEGD